MLIRPKAQGNLFSAYEKRSLCMYVNIIVYVWEHYIFHLLFIAAVVVVIGINYIRIYVYIYQAAAIATMAFKLINDNCI